MITRTAVAFLLAVLFAWTPSARAMYRYPDLVRVPVARLARNLEAKILKEPKNAEFRYQLARVYSMAYALKSEALNAVRSEDGELNAYFGAGPGSELPPGRYSADAAPEAKDPERRKQARERLIQAIDAYEAAIRLGKDDAAVRLGLGWCREENGEKEKAKEQYRKAFSAAWKAEKSLTMIFDTSMTVEAAGYLRKLLDPAKDSKEIADMDRKVRAIERVGMAVTPILVPLRSGLPLESLIDPGARVRFDLDGAGVAREWGWITPDAAWLVFTGSGGGIVESGRQMFGGFAFMIFWPNGYDALASLDDDGDGELRGDELAGIALWRDPNSNGVCEPGEVRPLSSHGIAALSCHYRTHSSGIPFNPAGCELEDGATRATYDWLVPSAAPR